MILSNIYYKNDLKFKYRYKKMPIFSRTETIIISIFSFGLGYIIIRCLEADFKEDEKRLHEYLDKRSLIKDTLCESQQ